MIRKNPALPGLSPRGLAVRLRGRDGLHAVESWTVAGVVVRVEPQPKNGPVLISVRPEAVTVVIG